MSRQKRCDIIKNDKKLDIFSCDDCWECVSSKMNGKTIYHKIFLRLNRLTRTHILARC